MMDQKRKSESETINYFQLSAVLRASFIVGHCVTRSLRKNLRQKVEYEIYMSRYQLSRNNYFLSSVSKIRDMKIGAILIK